MIGSGAAALATVVLGPGGAAAADTLPTWALDPTPLDSCKAGCGSCAACIHHGANKLFNTEAAADAGRAHPGCNCRIVSGQPLTTTVFQQMFASSPMADRRGVATARLLSGQVEQHSVPMIGGSGGFAALAVGGAGVLWVVSHRHRAAMADQAGSAAESMRR
jgi:hypothetical protein